jgi:hypothetical protein
MNEKSLRGPLALGICIAAGLVLMGIVLGQSALRVKKLDRVVTVKGLAEREVEADIALWPVTFTDANNDLGALYQSLDTKTKQIVDFLLKHGFEREEITVSPPAITDKLAERYGGQQNVTLRFAATQVVTVYTHKVDAVRAALTSMAELGKDGIVLKGDEYQNRTQYIFTKLNDIKPQMIEEATRNAREVAEKFAHDSESTVGKIKRASQGQFSITDRDQNNPHIKKVRVVSTVVYYLAD